MNLSNYQDLKVIIENLLYLSRDAIHMHVGLSVFIVVFVLRRKVDALPIITVVSVAVCMEWLDISHTYQSGYINWTASFHDLLNTCFWPVILFVLLKLHLKRSNQT